MSTYIQVFFLPGSISGKLPLIINSLARDCHIQVLEIIRKSPLIQKVLEFTRPFYVKFSLHTLSAYRRITTSIFEFTDKIPFIREIYRINGYLNKAGIFLLKTVNRARNRLKSVPVLNNVYDSIEGVSKWAISKGANWMDTFFDIAMLTYLNHWRQKYIALTTETRRLAKFALEVYQYESKQYRFSGYLDGPSQQFPVSNLPVVDKVTMRVSSILGTCDRNITEVLLRTGTWIQLVKNSKKKYTKTSLNINLV